MQKFIVGATCATLAIAGPAAAGSITTLFDGGNGGAPGWGVFFDVDITNSNGLTFTAFDVNARNNEGVFMGLEIYVIDGGSGLGDGNGPSADSDGWSLLGTGSAIAGDNNEATFIELEQSFDLGPGLYGFAVRTTGVGQNYTNATADNTFYSNDDLSLTLGHARSGSDGFGGTFWNDRIWNGSIYYTAVPAPGALALLGLAGLVGRRRRR